VIGNLSRFVLDWILYFRNSATKKHLIFVAFNIVFSATGLFLSEISKAGDNDAVKLATGLFTIVLAFSVFILPKKNAWIASLPYRNKLLLICLLLMLGFFMIPELTLSLLNMSYDANILYFKAPVSYSLLNIIDLAIIIFFLRIVFSTIAAWPTTKIVAKKNVELESLSTLNRFVVETLNKSPEKIIATASQIARQMTNAHSAWTEIFRDGKKTIAYSFNISQKNLSYITNYTHFSNYFKTRSESCLIDSLADHDYLYPISDTITYAKSMIVLPLFSGTERLGTCVLLKDTDYGFDPEDIAILNTLSQNLSIALQNSSLIQDSIEKEKYKSEMLLAQNIQRNLLPKEDLSTEEYSIAAFTEPAQEIGGDYYDLVYLSDKTPCLLIADVSGKGTSAAIIMSQMKGAVQALSPLSVSVSDLLKKLNNTLYGTIGRKNFITVAGLSFKPDGTINFVRAGHAPILVTQNGTTKKYMPIGLGVGLTNSAMFDRNLEELELKLTENDNVLLITDGINEISDANKQQFGYNHLISILESDNLTSAKEINRIIKEKITKFSAGDEYIDDMTVISLIYRKKSV
jgi:serine phosphatase RsbU (regulator of sigma subunit)